MGCGSRWTFAQLELSDDSMVMLACNRLPRGITARHFDVPRYEFMNKPTGAGHDGSCGVLVRHSTYISPAYVWPGHYEEVAGAVARTCHVLDAAQRDSTRGRT